MRFNIADSSLLNVRLGKHELELAVQRNATHTKQSVCDLSLRAWVAFRREYLNPSGNPSYANANDLALGDNHLGVELMGWKGDGSH